MAKTGFPSMTALLGLLAVAGYQNRDKLAEWFGGAQGGQAGRPLPGGQGMGGQGMGGSPGMGSGLPQGLDRILGGFGGSGGGMGGAMSGAGGLAGGLAGGIGGLLTNGLGELVDRFRGAGQAKAVDSWVSTGPNHPIGEAELEQAIGPDVLDELQQRTGLPRQELLARLAQRLPSAIDQYTPDGRL
jgi:uncharacterized protein YidB (DUF937 family)